ncbi:uncharacterized protein LOC101170700 isoform X3 [Oryzias latipes]|uniref:uncharacterized protein LOC101170700 isoform X2 n=1 Tax=Oryzias latipes TaxID=8090 RepID=UPI0009DB54B9|nr:uncharacterized protein LOC101170700 isoform X2 [Oryzias latipes]XP_023819274.1 uncharacterized protein LOC101170700 isoform X3 [Oryzias latipes]
MLIKVLAYKIKSFFLYILYRRHKGLCITHGFFLKDTKVKKAQQVQRLKSTPSLSEQVEFRLKTLNSEETGKMFRISLVLGVSLLLGAAAKPWDKRTEKAFQETSMFKHDKGEPSQRVEVEPPEDMDKIHYDVAPRMRIWKSVRDGELDKQPVRPKEGLDELHLTSVSEINIVQIQKLDPPSNIPIKVFQGDAKFKPVGDEDGIDRPVFRDVVVKKPEADMDEIYHKMKNEVAAGHLGPLVAKNNLDAASHRPETNVDQNQRTVHLEPEEDMDAVYHKKTFIPALHQKNTKPAAAPVHMPSQRRHAEPEEDMDAVYHRKNVFPALHQEDTKPAAASVHRRHAEPEEDMDAVYHKKTFIPALHQKNTKPAAAPVHMPSQRRHTEPEEDMDAVYHRKTFIPALHQEDTKPAAASVHRRHSEPEEDMDAIYHR